MLSEELLTQPAAAMTVTRSVASRRPLRGRPAAQKSRVSHLLEADLVELEQKHPEGMTLSQVLSAFGEHGINLSEATFRKYVQLGLLGRSRRVGRKGKHQGSLGMYPATTVRRLNTIRQMLASHYTIEDIQRSFLRFADEIDGLQRVLGSLLDGLSRELERGQFSADRRRAMSKEVLAIRKLGGDVVHLTSADMQLGRGETIADTARVLSRYVDAIMIRILNHDALLELAAHATVPVINGLTRRSHPCQVMADLMTFEEHCGPIEGKTVAWTGDDNNVLASWAHAAERFKFQLNIATPPELAPKKPMRDWIKATGAPIVLGNDPEAAVRGADCVVTDTWVSMGDKEGEHRHNVLRPYQVNAKLMSLAKPKAVFMHCLPAHRGEEVTDEVIDGPQSVVFDEAENRLHAQKGILAWCFETVA